MLDVRMGLAPRAYLAAHRGSCYGAEVTVLPDQLDGMDGMGGTDPTDGIGGIGGAKKDSSSRTARRHQPGLLTWSSDGTVNYWSDLAALSGILTTPRFQHCFQQQGGWGSRATNTSTSTSTNANTGTSTSTTNYPVYSACVTGRGAVVCAGGASDSGFMGVPIHILSRLS